MKDIETKGIRVKVVKGNKVPKNTEGVVVWIGYYERGYVGSGVDPYQCIQKIGIKDDDGNIWYTYTKNCEEVVGETHIVRIYIYTQYSDGDLELEEVETHCFRTCNEAIDYANNKNLHNAWLGAFVEVFIDNKIYSTYSLE